MFTVQSFRCLFRDFGDASFPAGLFDENAGVFHCSHFLGGRSLPAGDDRTSVSHSSSRGRGLSGDESDHGFGHMIADKLGRLLFSSSTDLADHHHRVGLAVFLKELERVDKVCADHRIAADSNSS